MLTGGGEANEFPPTGIGRVELEVAGTAMSRSEEKLAGDAGDKRDEIRGCNSSGPPPHARGAIDHP